MLHIDLVILFRLFDSIDVHFHSFRRYFGVEIGHLQMVIYTSRREEMINVVRSTHSLITCSINDGCTQVGIIVGCAKG